MPHQLTHQHVNASNINIVINTQHINTQHINTLTHQHNHQRSPSILNTKASTSTYHTVIKTSTDQHSLTHQVMAVVTVVTVVTVLVVTVVTVVTEVIVVAVVTVTN
jgi:hypothetical protein